MHTQARYCIVDWARVHRLNETREAVCHAAIDKDIEAQTGMADSKASKRNWAWANIGYRCLFPLDYLCHWSAILYRLRAAILGRARVHQGKMR